MGEMGRRRPRRFAHSPIRRFILLISGYRCIRGNPERCFQQARGAKPARRVRKDFRAAFAANSDYSAHCPRLGVRPHLVLRKILVQLTPDFETRISRIYTNGFRKVCLF